MLDWQARGLAATTIPSVPNFFNQIALSFISIWMDQGLSVRWGFTPTAANLIIQQSGWTKDYPYGGGLLPS